MTEEEWMKIAQEFHEKWIFKTCIGAMDGKYILIKPPPNSGSYYFNYKHSFSIVLLAIVDANYRFVYTDIGCNGRISDGGVYRNCNLTRALEEKCLNIPEPTLLPGTQSLSPYVIVADDAFPLNEYIMKPRAAKINQLIILTYCLKILIFYHTKILRYPKTIIIIL